MKISRRILLICLSLLFTLSGCYMSQFSKGGKLDMSDTGYDELMPFPSGFEKALYKANLEVNGHEFSGLMMLKDAGGSYKVSFFSELGLNFFDFEIRNWSVNNHFKLYVKNIYAPLDKDILLNKFEKYFSMLLAPGPGGVTQKTYLKKEGIGIMIMMKSYKGKDGYISTNLVEPYKEIVNVGGIFNKDRITITLSPKRINYSPESILIEQPGFRLRFSLQLVN